MLRVLAFILGMLASPAWAQVPPPVPALPDTSRLALYTLASSNCVCSVGFAIYGDGTDVDNWIAISLNGSRVFSTDPSFGWVLSSPTGPIGTIPRPITDGIITFNSPQTGPVAVIGLQRPRRLTTFPENRGVTARDLNLLANTIFAELRENWDKTGGVTCLTCGGGGGGGGAVSSVSNIDGSLMISPNIGAVVASLATGAATHNIGTLGGVLAGTLPNPTFATGLSPTFAGLTLSGLAGGGTQCVQVSNTGAQSGTGAPCGSGGGGGGVTNISNADGSLTFSAPTGAVVGSVAANGVTNAKLAQMPAYTVKCDNTGSTANAADCTFIALRQAPTNSTPGGYYWNTFNTTSDTEACAFCVDIDVEHYYGGAPYRGARTAVLGFNIQTAANTGTQATYGVGVEGIGQGNSGDGGTGVTLTTAKGFYYGANMIARNNGTNVAAVIATENDVQTTSASSQFYSFGDYVVNFEAVQASGLDAGFVVTAGPMVGADHGSPNPWGPGIGFHNAISIAETAGAGLPPIDSNGTILSGHLETLSTIHAAYGIDLRNFTISVAAFWSNGFEVDGSGNTALTSIFSPSGNFHIDSSGNVAGASLGIVTGKGFGSTVTQATSITTAVTINKISGYITTVNNAFTANTAVVFQVLNSLSQLGDVVVVTPQSTNQMIIFATNVGAGTFNIVLYPLISGTSTVTMSYELIHGTQN